MDNTESLTDTKHFTTTTNNSLMAMTMYHNILRDNRTRSGLNILGDINTFDNYYFNILHI